MAGPRLQLGSLTFVHYEFDAGAFVHEHAHPQEEVWQIIDGELEVSIGDETMRAGPCFVAIVPPNTPHSVRALTDGKAIVTDYPRREMS
jgi:quercetin dioxygenase-like cupin family protein